MDRSELAQRYLEGQISRRVFIRRLVAGGVSAMAALAYADVLVSAPAAAASDFYIFVFDYGFTPTPAPKTEPNNADPAPKLHPAVKPIKAPCATPPQLP